MIGGKLFTGSTYGGNTINKVFDFASGVSTDVNYTFTGMPGTYRTNITYDAFNDMLYVTDYAQGFYRVQNAAALFGMTVPSNPVPEPATWVIFSISLFFAMYKRILWIK